MPTSSHFIFIPAVLFVGLVVGWVHKPAALIGGKRVGKGGFVAATFRLMTGEEGADPVADALFDALILHANGLTTRLEPADP